MKLLGVLTAVAMMAATPTLAEEVKVYGPYQATVNRVIDADTVELTVHAWVGQSNATALRVLGVDTPEKRGSGCGSHYKPSKVPEAVKAYENQLGREATDFVKGLLQKGQRVTISEVQEGKYAGRVVGYLKLPDGRDLSSLLISEGHAVSYFGGTKSAPWCEGKAE